MTYYDVTVTPAICIEMRLVEKATVLSEQIKSVAWHSTMNTHSNFNTLLVYNISFDNCTIKCM